ncbi:hypothetical protein CCHL11_03050 [Colletotrichum chlorophyti]|uniref:Uncharacterized protein n=1 Tax=Colletotrichum chlorophyti TaxID=708187 RepID=A0A1Q8RGP4_9PEZI|nr:hypothetical protein CCHL11_03050 [Colletotrichum chlorophyti]
MATSPAVIATLEVLLQHSLRNKGIADVSTEGYVKYGWLFVPTIAMAALALAYNAVDTTNRLLPPFQQLQRAQEANVVAMK